VYEENAARRVRELPVRFATGVLVVALLMFAHASEGATYMALRTCATGSCDSFATLKLDARGYALSTASTLPLGSIIVSSSYSVPLSAYFRICLGERGQRNACNITPDDVAAIDLDNSNHVRALAFPPIDIPPEVAPTPSYTEEAQHYITTIINVTGPSGTGKWHGLITGNWVWWELFDARTQIRSNTYVNDRILAKFSNGQTAEFKFVGPYVTSGMHWHIVSDSIRNADGSDPAAPPPAAGTPGSGGINLAGAWVPPGSVTDIFPGNWCAVVSSVCVDAACAYRTVNIPCLP
jgi:hypothetical protein